MSNLTVVLYAFGFVSFAFAAFGYHPIFESHRVRLVAMGLMFWIAVSLFTGVAGILK